MPQIFKPMHNTLMKLSIFIVMVLALMAVGIAEVLTRSSYATEVGVHLPQPIPFSHKHHVKGLGLDCRFCHTTVERSAYAGMPATQTCITCHSQIWSHEDVIKPIHESWNSDQPIHWNRVHRLPDYVYFDHSIHVSKGVGCVSCHGHVEEMPLVNKVMAFHMYQCLDCHRHPERFIRPKEEVFNMNWHSGDERAGAALVNEYHIDKNRITNCSTCHR